MTATKTTTTEQLNRLRAFCPRGSTVYGCVKHVSQLDMSRDISFYVVRNRCIECINSKIVAVGIGNWNLRLDALRIVVGFQFSGCSMDMIFAIVNELSELLYDDGYALNHEQI